MPSIDPMSLLGRTIIAVDNVWDSPILSLDDGRKIAFAIERGATYSEYTEEPDTITMEDVTPTRPPDA